MTDVSLGVASSPDLLRSPPWTGTVIATQANYYQVRLDQPPAEESAIAPHLLLCTRRARLKKIGQQVWVGDRVVVEEPDWQNARGAIAQVMPRQTELDRPPVANASHILLVFALVEPTLDRLQLSRFLVKAESTQLSVSLCLSKADLVPIEQQQRLSADLQAWGYHPLMISNYTGQNLDPIRRQLRDRITVISGPSGVGKSSLINQLIPSVDLRVGAVSGKLGRGRHTTRHVELFELPSGGLLADTPGFNQPDWDCTAVQLARCFPEIRQRLEQASCQFSNCLHRDEPDCAVRGDWERYDHYLTFLDEVTQYETAQEKLGDGESTTKLKVGEDGQVTHEPKLSTKKYRRPSRRAQHQTLHHLCGNLQDLTLDEED
ncbi:small ribosomal subunit biogenesis GTPase RsgA [Leptolyngbya sp. CCY15150]|uniref:small ribosomal subunit biogenesis GTPase RsgA n=1 Tax=Leptolyngbya sp. CCY15150 TaxID=2767772 RepID=UPI0019519F7B|nr:small ribosomal subunit biogenesis GTPase RsgA [Leptolyngbya sp. CCY15150]